MFFDRDEEGREILMQALRQRDPQFSPIETLRLLAHRLIVDQVPYLEFSARSQRFVDTVAQSETLKARARAIRDEIAQDLSIVLAGCAKREPNDIDAQLAAGLLLATWTVAFTEAHRIFREGKDTKLAITTFLELVDKGTVALKTAMAGSPYA